MLLRMWVSVGTAGSPLLVSAHNGDDVFLAHFVGWTGCLDISQGVVEIQSGNG